VPNWLALVAEVSAYSSVDAFGGYWSTSATAMPQASRGDLLGAGEQARGEADDESHEAGSGGECDHNEQRTLAEAVAKVSPRWIRGECGESMGEQKLKARERGLMY
jgi:hypothetical protein